MKSVVFNQGTSNQKLVKLLNVTFDKPYFVHINKKVFVFYDPPHLLKSIRNNLQHHDFMLDGYASGYGYQLEVY